MDILQPRIEKKGKKVGGKDWRGRGGRNPPQSPSGGGSGGEVICVFQKKVLRGKKQLLGEKG